jgi:polyisoprenoid-binding protein YceI
MKILIFVFLMMIQQQVFAAVQSLSAEGGRIEILAQGRPSFIKIHGIGSPAKGKIQVQGNDVHGDFDFALATLNTGIELRDEHMKTKYLEVEKFPTAHLLLEHVDTDKTWSLNAPLLKKTEFTGILTLHGISKSITGQFSLGEKRDVEAQFRIKLSDFAVNLPTFAGVTVSDEVVITVKFDKIDLL